MAAFGASAIAGAGGNATQIDTANINVTGTDLCLVIGVSEDGTSSPTLAARWDPAGNNEAMTGTFATLSVGSYADSALYYLDNPTAANAPVRGTASASIADLRVWGAFFTAAGDVVAADTANSALSGSPTSITATAPNVVSGDMVVDWLTTVGAAPPSLTAGSGQTRQDYITTGSYVAAGGSTQLGSTDGVMSWTMTGVGYGAILIAARIPDAASSGLDISAALATLTVASQNASVNLTREVTAALATLNLTPNSAAVQLDKNIAALSASLAIASSASTVNRTREVVVGSAALDIASLGAGIGSGINISATSVSLNITSNSASVNTTRELAATAASLTAASSVSAIDMSRNIVATPATLTVSTRRATINDAVLAIIISSRRGMFTFLGGR